MAQFETRWELAIGAPVAALDGPFGQLQRVILSPPLQRVVALVVRYGVLPPRDIVVPVEQVAAATDAGVAIRASRAELAHQPAFDSAHSLELAPSGAGAAVLTATRLGAVAQALASDARTRGAHLFVQARHGVVSLRGEVGSADVRAAAEACAAGVPQVRGVINAVQAPGVAITADDLRVVQPGIGQEVYAPEVRIGRVAQVIIDPRHRRVTAMVVQSQLPDLARATSPTPSDELTRPNRHVIIPIDAVADVTESAVLLNISGGAAAQYHGFDPSRFVAPPADWQPPYPYRAADVLIERPLETMYSVSRTASSLRCAGAGGVHDTPSWQQLNRGMPVLFRDQNIGTIEHIWVDSSHGGIGQIVVRLTASPHSEITVPLDRVPIVEDLGAFADVDSAQVELLLAAPQAQVSESVAHADLVGGEVLSRSTER